MILRRGKQPSAVDCFTHENVAVVIARLAISAAMLAMRKTGQKAPPGDRIKFPSVPFSSNNRHASTIS